MNPILFEQLLHLILGASGKVGLKKDQIVAHKGTISLGKGGISIWWYSGSNKTDGPEWRIVESYTSSDMITGESRVVTQVVLTLAEKDIYAVARAALLLSVEKSLDIVLSELIAQ